MHNFTSLRRTPLALLVATLVGWGAAAQDAPTDAAPADGVPDPNIEEIVTIGRLRSTALDVVGARLEEDVVSDFLSADAISRVGDSTVSAALRRVPGLTLVNDQFVYVRGLGERYSSVQLNGAQVPSPGPHTQRDPARHLSDRDYRQPAGAKRLLAGGARGVRRRQRGH